MHVEYKRQHKIYILIILLKRHLYVLLKEPFLYFYCRVVVYKVYVLDDLPL